MSREQYRINELKINKIIPYCVLPASLNAIQEAQMGRGWVLMLDRCPTLEVNNRGNGLAGWWIFVGTLTCLGKIG
jgi:hypothetical protein